MVKKLPGELWQKIKTKLPSNMNKKYAVSNLGRLASFNKSFDEDGSIIAGSSGSSYTTLNLRTGTESVTLYIHKEVAKAFLKKDSPKQKFVVHKNHNTKDNKVKNLKWVSREELTAHQQKNPKNIERINKLKERKKGMKLNLNQVKAIKNSANTYKNLAEKYNVSEMTIYRIKSGINWGHIK